ncbi:DNRLRE domain-containing protein [Sinosporangium siamense]|uniref:Carbohydrate-binding module family 96 domain-containing protein n=1 Tax=Sinosporangium siamense TaxID=1367973 RepID=A0A919RD37_9ACTN|nr:DNRLRE domain-containing protein [Sinosporangium siamense]GII91678.1 hypothetical protein Ssi02_19090 [Sinosporangium siamense]
MRLAAPIVLAAALGGAPLSAGPVSALTGDTSVSVELRPSHDGYILQGARRDQSRAQHLKVGFNGDRVARSFLTWETGALAGKRILSATLKLWSQHSWSCTPRAWEVWSAEPMTATPAIVTAAARWPGPAPLKQAAVSTETRGWSDRCADGWVSVDLRDLVQSWADQRKTKGAVVLKATDETDRLAWKRFASAEATTNRPILTVIFTESPGRPAVPIGTARK